MGGSARHQNFRQFENQRSSAARRVGFPLPRVKLFRLRAMTNQFSEAFFSGGGKVVVVLGATGNGGEMLEFIFVFFTLQGR